MLNGTAFYHFKCLKAPFPFCCSPKQTKRQTSKALCAVQVNMQGGYWTQQQQVCLVPRQCFQVHNFWHIAAAWEDHVNVCWTLNFRHVLLTKNVCMFSILMDGSCLQWEGKPRKSTERSQEEIRDRETWHFTKVSDLWNDQAEGYSALVWSQSLATGR